MADDVILAQLGLDEEQWVVMGCSWGQTLTFTPPSKAHHPDMQQLMAHPDGTMSGVLVKLVIGWNRMEAKLRDDMYCGASGFL